MSALSVVMLMVAAPSAAAESDEQGRARIEQLVRDLATERRGVLLQSDPRLDDVAAAIAGDALMGAADRAAVRDRMWTEGLRDFEYAPISLISGAVPPSDALRPVLADPSVDWKRFNTVGIGLQRRGDRLALCVLLTRRAASFTPADDAPGHELIALPAGYTSPRLYVTEPTGLVSTRVPQEMLDGRWLAATEPGMLEGAWLFELVAMGTSGIEVLSLWPRRRAGTAPVVHTRPDGGKKQRGDILSLGGPGEAGVDRPTSSAGWVAGAGPGPNRAPRPDDVRAAEDQLWEMIQSSRRSRGLLRLMRDPGITRAARTHAGDIGRGERFGHVTSSGTAMHRLAAQGLTAVRAVENVAVVSNVADAHAAFMASPSHRAAILDPEITHAGVGAVVKRDAAGRWSVAVSEVFAILMDEADPATWEEAVFAQLVERRRELGLRKLTRRSRLDLLAREASEQLLDSGTPTLSPEERSAMAENVRFHFHTARRVAVDLVIGTDIVAVRRLSHAIEEDLVEVGVGVARADEPFGEHAAGSLVVTLLFVER